MDVKNSRKNLCLILPFLFFVITGCIFSDTTYADPLVVNSSLSANLLAANLMGTGVTFSNEKYTGNIDANGTFTGGTGVIGFESGIILSSGRAADVVGPNNSTSYTTSFGSAGDPDLETLNGTTNETHDAASLEFDFVPSADTIAFSFVFGSEEYNEFVGTFNDIFGIFLDGVNVAIIPGTAVPISINNINNCANSSYYINNNTSGGSGTCGSIGVPSANLNTQFDGLTVVINLKINITPGVSHHLKFAIADVQDSAYDSAVFIKSASLISGTDTITPTNTPTYTATGTFTITATYTPTSTFTETPSITCTFTNTQTYTFTPTVTMTITKTCTPTMTPTPFPFCLELKGCFPNPVAVDANIVYRLCRPGPVKLKMYTVSGEVVRVMEQDGIRGYNSMYWDGRNRAGKETANGVFIYSLEAESQGEKALLWGKFSVVR
jgi:hypothetical protein